MFVIENSDVNDGCDEVVFEGSRSECERWIEDRNDELVEKHIDDVLEDEEEYLFESGFGSDGENGYYNDLEYYWKIVVDFDKDLVIDDR